MATQTGPRLTITGTCEGCEHHHAERYARQGDSGYEYWCSHPEGASERRYSDTTRDWCPELPAARLAMARSVVAESDAAESCKVALALP